MIQLNLRKYLNDRFGFFAIYLVGIGVFLLVVELDLSMNSKKLEWTSLLYGLTLSFFFFLVFLAIDYTKWTAFIKKVEAYKQSQRIWNVNISIPDRITYEQKLVLEAITTLQQQYANEMDELHRKRRQESIFLNQWIHQMKTPVAVIELLTQKPKQNDRNMLSSIQEENRRILDGLDLALHMARLDQFEQDYKIEKVDLPSFLRNLINENKKIFIYYGVFPKVEGTTTHMIHTDPKWLAIALKQVISNALKYTRMTSHENKKITFRFMEVDATVKLQILDNGIGIPKQDVKRVWEPFFTGSNGRKTREATGMGLYITKTICDKLHHKLMIQSKEGEGTTISFHFAEEEAYFKMMQK